MGEYDPRRSFDVAIYRSSRLKKLAHSPSNCQALAGNRIEKAGRDSRAGRPPGIIENGCPETSLSKGPDEDCPGQSPAHNDDIDFHQCIVTQVDLVVGAGIVRFRRHRVLHV